MFSWRIEAVIYLWITFAVRWNFHLYETYDGGSWSEMTFPPHQLRILYAGLYSQSWEADFEITFTHQLAERIRYLGKVLMQVTVVSFGAPIERYGRRFASSPFLGKHMHIKTQELPFADRNSGPRTWNWLRPATSKTITQKLRTPNVKTLGANI